MSPNSPNLGKDLSIIEISEESQTGGISGRLSSC